MSSELTITLIFIGVSVLFLRLYWLVRLRPDEDSYRWKQSDVTYEYKPRGLE